SPVDLLLYCRAHHPALHSFPTRRSSDLRDRKDRAARLARQHHDPKAGDARDLRHVRGQRNGVIVVQRRSRASPALGSICWRASRSEEHTSELQSLAYLVCRLLLEKKKTK